jgi:hypothetical protein
MRTRRSARCKSKQESAHVSIMPGLAVGRRHGTSRRDSRRCWSTCKPTLTFKEVKFSQMQPPTLERKWTAIVSADASRCATTAGYFEIGSRGRRKTASELEFREQFIWSAPSVLVGVDFWADEAVERYWIDSVQACLCAK